MQARKVATGVVLAAAVAYSGFVIHQAVKPASPASSIGHTVAVGNLPGDEAPNFVLKTPTGKTISLASLRGHGVWLNFWATWCPNCKVELPIVEQEHKIYGNRVAIVGVDVQESAATVSHYAAAHGLTYSMALDVHGGVAAAYGVTGLPTSVFIGPHGHIRAVVTGAIENLNLANQYLERVASGPSPG
ncbi:TlpA family protein disulfide reductase [Sulfobacillus harzensis]|uniref:Redoxin domain-containing protein n=1 Tax=Sulfobacillus harzensis TaxID=2729629 RepID=A0A7Y0Q438_9FIRM|nr:redoxin domain-containing protein [Sulfobacillus harzensis]NMP24005.1 redoxin domain-containing protein [Sulfobacillus harzensis]